MSYIYTAGLLHVRQRGRLSASKATPADVTAAPLIVEYPVNGQSLSVYNGLSVHTCQAEMENKRGGALS